jgi:hypothetical protein
MTPSILTRTRDAWMRHLYGRRDDTRVIIALPYQVMRALTFPEVLARTGMHPDALARTLGRLEARGFARRYHPGPGPAGDAKNGVTRFHLTPAGRIEGIRRGYR